MINTIQRIRNAFRIRVRAARRQRDAAFFGHPTNGDEARYRNKIASYSKGLPHNALGEVTPGAYRAMVSALTSGVPANFEAIPLGGPLDLMCPISRLTNPQAGLGFDMEGPDPNHLTQPPPPRFDSAEEAGEIVENYWMALTRDIHFSDYTAANSTIQAAVNDLNSLSDFRGPKVNGQVTPDILFRGFTAGDRVGPYLSQFMLHKVPYGAQTIVQTMKTVLPGIQSDYMTTEDSWLKVQNGICQGKDKFDMQERYIRNGRDLGQWVHIDVLFQAYFNACLLLLGWKAPFDDGNPYQASATQMGFGTFGSPHIQALVCEVAARALKAVWFQKWLVHRRLRPEVFGGRIHFHVKGAANYPIHPDALNSQALQAVHAVYNSFFLPMAFPEGSPTHPAYGAGHATVAGACTTILKAWFKEDTKLVDLIDPFTGMSVKPVVAAPDGLSLMEYTEADANQLTVGGELNKVAANIGIGRNIAGVHWRSDFTESLKLGEQVAIGVLQDFREVYNEDFFGFTLTRFDGTVITV
jgi:hypothetical protein